MRHELVKCETIDNDPKVGDLRTLSAWGVNLGVDYAGRYGVVTNTARYSQYYRPDTNFNSGKTVVYREYIGNCPQKG